MDRRGSSLRRHSRIRDVVVADRDFSEIDISLSWCELSYLAPPDYSLVSTTKLLSLRQTTPPKADFTHDNPKRYIHKPLGYSWFHKELAAMPKSWVATTGNLVFHRQHTKVRSFSCLYIPACIVRIHLPSPYTLMSIHTRLLPSASSLLSLLSCLLVPFFLNTYIRNDVS